MTRAALKHLLHLGLTLVGGVTGGWLIDHIWAGVALSLLPWLGWYLYQTLQLDRWLRDTSRPPPLTMGLWRAVFTRLLNLQQESEQQIQQLQQSVEAFRAVTDTFPEPILLIDESQALRWYNDAAVAQLGLRPKNDTGQMLRNLIRQPAFIAWLDDPDQPHVEIESPVLPDIRFQVIASSMSAGRKLLIFRDVSELHAVENMRRDFVANVSHELRTPLTVLVGYLEALEEDSNPELAMVMERMRDQTYLMQNLINDLIEISRLQSQDIQGREERVDMSALLAQLYEQTESLSDGRHQVRFHIDCAHDIYGAAKDLESAFSNLITNAVRYTPDGGTIELRWSLNKAGEGVLAVSDSGIGIPAKDIPRLTERFYRVAKDRSRASGGSGLGLSIVKHALNGHDAQLKIDSELGQGSTFSCIFPPGRLLPPQPARRQAS
ncbi:MAG: phosphate regulon sensor histidine kinase PhoR [Wenzhouxiangellaceae bacterium]